MNQIEYDNLLASDIGKYYADPLGFVMYAYDWTNDANIQVAKLLPPYSMMYNSEYGPDLWACELLDRIGRQVREHGFDGTLPVAAIREAVVSGHGIGKGALTAWLTDWIMSTRPYCHGTVTATTSDQLSSKTWAEIIKWTKRCITGHWFDHTSGKGHMSMWRRGYKESWYVNAQTCDEENSEAFAGQHAVNSTSFYIFDEASGVPDKIKEVAEGGLTDGEPMMFALGNGTQATGWFKDCFGKQRHRWNTTCVDSRNVQITNKQHLQELIDDYGIDSDIVKIRVRGMFPSISAKQFISAADADAGYQRHLLKTQYNFAPKILTLDNAAEGDDDLVIGMRQGLRYDILWKQGKNDNDIEVANRLARFEDEEHANAVFIDYGYGTGVASAGKTWGRNWRTVNSASESPDPSCLNMRAYMAKQVRQWLKDGGSYNSERLHDELTCFETVPRMDQKLQIEAKKDIKRTVGYSPGHYDSLALSLAYPIIPPPPQAANPSLPQGAHDATLSDYDPYATVR